MAKQWFNYANPSTTSMAQKSAQNYILVGPYPTDPPNYCQLADRVCLIYTYFSSIAGYPSPTIGGAPAISTRIQTYINAIAAGPVVPQPPVGKKYVYVRGS